jgi:hypothetical protein
MTGLGNTWQSRHARGREAACPAISMSPSPPSAPRQSSLQLSGSGSREVSDGRDMRDPLSDSGYAWCVDQSGHPFLGRHCVPVYSGNATVRHARAAPIFSSHEKVKLSSASPCAPASWSAARGLFEVFVDSRRVQHGVPATLSGRSRQRSGTRTV